MSMPIRSFIAGASFVPALFLAGASPAMERSNWPDHIDWPGPLAQELLPEGARDETRRLAIDQRARGQCPEDLDVAVLAPPYTGVTIDPSPTLFWFSSRETDREVQIDLTNDATDETKRVATFEDGVGAGIHPISLAEVGIMLQPGTDYEWSVAIVCTTDKAAEDIVSVGTVRLIEPPGDLAQQLRGAAPEQRAALLIDYGIWYDALEALAALIERKPSDGEPWQSARARLLGQVGLDEAAAYEP